MWAALGAVQKGWVKRKNWSNLLIWVETGLVWLGQHILPKIVKALINMSAEVATFFEWGRFFH